MQSDKLFRYAFIGISLLLLCFIAFKAWVMPITHDAAFSYRMLYHPEDSKLLWKMANNHPLNTLCMWVSFHLLPKFELAYRWQNVLAFLIYAGFTYQLTKNLDRIALKILLASLLLLNLFILDFFSLARGYGLCNAFLIPCIYYAIEAAKPKVTNGSNWLKAVIFGCLSMASVYISFNVFIAMLFVLGLIQLSRLRQDTLGGWFRKYAFAWGLAVISIVLVAYALLEIRKFGDLLYGADFSLFGESFKRNAKTFLYTMSPNPLLHLFVQIVWYAGFVFGFVALSYAILKKRFSYLLVPFCLLLLTLSFRIIQYWLFSTPYPLGRTFNPLYLTWAIAIPLLISYLLEIWPNMVWGKTMSAVSLTLSVLIIVNFAWGINFDRCFKWYYNANDRESAEIIRAEYERLEVPIEYGCFFRFATTIPFFYLNDLYDEGQLKPHHYRYGKEEYQDAKNCHFIYMLQDQFDYLDKDHPFEVIRFYENNQTVLIKNKTLVD